MDGKAGVPFTMRTLLIWIALALLGVWSFFHFEQDLTSKLLELLFITPLVARALAPSIFAIFPALRDHARHSVHGKWQGKFYSFGKHQLRLFLIDDTVWIAAQDLESILAPPPDAREWRLLGADYGTIPEQEIAGCTEAGLGRMLKNRTEHRRAAHEMIRFKWWLEHEAFPNLKKNPATSAS